MVVSGTPGAGKTTLARPLAELLGFALLSKDDIKEALYGALGGAAGDVEFSRRMSAAAMEALWALAARCSRVVLEANFRTRSEYERGRLLALGGEVVEVHCRVPVEEAMRRFAERARGERTHPAHPLKEMTAEQLAEYAEPFGMGPVLEVDTTGPVDAAAVARWVLEAGGDAGDGAAGG